MCDIRTNIEVHYRASYCSAPVASMCILIIFLYMYIHTHNVKTSVD